MTKNKLKKPVSFSSIIFKHIQALKHTCKQFAVQKNTRHDK